MQCELHLADTTAGGLQSSCKLLQGGRIPPSPSKHFNPQVVVVSDGGGENGSVSVIPTS